MARMGELDRKYDYFRHYKKIEELTGIEERTFLVSTRANMEDQS